MQLYIWEGDGVLQDYTSGMIVAMAPDIVSAFAAIKKCCDYAEPNFPNTPSEIIELGDVKAEPKAWVVWGGG